MGCTMDITWKACTLESQGPFQAYYQGFGIDACSTEITNAPECASSNFLMEQGQVLETRPSSAKSL